MAHHAGLRVVLLIEHLELGGAERQAVLLARELRHLGLDATVWALGQRGGQGQLRQVALLCSQYGIPLRESPVKIPDNWLEWPAGLSAFAKALKATQVDVLLPYWNKPNMAAALVWRQAGARTCIWGQRDEGRLRPPRWLEAMAVANTPWFISNSGIGAEYLVQTLGVPHTRVRTVHNGVDPAPSQAARPEWRSRLGIPLESFAVVMIAHLHRFKDHATLLEAWKLFLEQAGSLPVAACLVFAGDFADAATDLQEQAARLGIARSVKFLGRIEDVSGLVGSMDVCVHSSLTEGVPNAVLEAMHAGLPVVGTDIPGIREALGAEAAHYLVPPKDAVALGAKLWELYCLDPAARAHLGEANRRRIAMHFSPQRLAAGVLEIVDGALTQSRPYSMLGSLLRSFAVLHLLLAIWRIIGACRMALRRGVSRMPWFWRFERYL